VVLFRTLKVQSFILTEVCDCGFLIVVTSSAFLKRKDMFKGKKAVSPEHHNPQPSIYINKFTLYTYTIYALVDLDSSGSPGVRPTPGLTSSTKAVCVCVHAHAPTTLRPAKIEKSTRQNPCRYPCHNTLAQKMANIDFCKE